MAEEATAVNDNVVADTTTTESAPVETTESEATGDYFDEAFAEVETDESTNESDGDQVEESTDETQERGDDQVPPEAKADKSINRFQQLANENRELREQLARLNSQETQVANEQALLDEINPETGEYFTPQEVQRISLYQANQARQEQIAQERYQLQVQANLNSATLDTEKALRDFPQLDSNSPDFDPQLASDFDTFMSQSAIVDNQGNLIGLRQSPYEISKKLVGIANRVRTAEQTTGRANAQRSVEQMLSRADTTSSTGASAKDETKDFIDSFFD